MDSAAELSFKMESAKQWQKNVEEEFKRVDELLKLVAEELKTQPYEDDTIMMGLKKTGEALAEAFQTLSQNFMNAVAGLSDPEPLQRFSKPLQKQPEKSDTN